MTRRSWHILKEQGALTLARRLPIRFDVAASVVIEGGAGLRKSRVAAQVRQDMWRSLQNLRGFAPVVRVAERGNDLEITAGGSVAGRVPKSETEARIRAVLDNETHRARWVRFARKA
ncbi:hypothetical protein [Celeribacter sp. ULVN23_4]